MDGHAHQMVAYGTTHDAQLFALSIKRRKDNAQLWSVEKTRALNAGHMIHE
jgi:hypothetical protein